MVCKPCGHVVACSVCAAEWAAQKNTCPVCRKEVTEIESVRKLLNGETCALVGAIVCDGKDVTLRLNAHVAGGDVLSLLTQLRHVALEI